MRGAKVHAEEKESAVGLPARAHIGAFGTCPLHQATSEFVCAKDICSNRVLLSLNPLPTSPVSAGSSPPVGRRQRGCPGSFGLWWVMDSVQLLTKISPGQQQLDKVDR